MLTLRWAQLWGNPSKEKLVYDLLEVIEYFLQV